MTDEIIRVFKGVLVKQGINVFLYCVVLFNCSLAQCYIDELLALSPFLTIGYQCRRLHQDKETAVVITYVECNAHARISAQVVEYAPSN